jgi:pilus assembly protein Flp/PilA
MGVTNPRQRRTWVASNANWYNPVLWTRSDSHVWIIKELPMKNLFVRFVKNESGATAIEYGLIAAGIAVAIIAVVNGLGSQLNVTFSKVKTAMAAH